MILINTNSKSPFLFNKVRADIFYRFFGSFSTYPPLSLPYRHTSLYICPPKVDFEPIFIYPLKIKLGWLGGCRIKHKLCLFIKQSGVAYFQISQLFLKSVRIFSNTLRHLIFVLSGSPSMRARQLIFKAKLNFLSLAPKGQIKTGFLNFFNNIKL